MDPALDPSWASYPETILEFGTTPPVTIDLRRRIPPAELARLRSLAPGGTFAVVTPCNPRGQTLLNRDNRARLAALTDELRQAGRPFMPVSGVSPDGRHREPGVAVAMSLPDAVTVAEGLEQSALFWFDGEAFWLVPVLVGAERRRLPLGRGLY